MIWYFEVLNKYATFDGRAHREEYWMFFLLSTLVSLLFLALDLALQLHTLWFYSIYNLVVLIPTIAVSFRRMHDTGRSGWWLLLPIVNFILPFLDSQSGDNRFGPNPKADAAYSSPKTIQPEANITNDKQHSFVAVEEDEFYETVASELESGNTQKGLWTKLYAQCGGDERQTKVKYIEQRVALLTEEHLLKHSPVTKTELKANKAIEKSESGENFLPAKLTNLNKLLIAETATLTIIFIAAAYFSLPVNKQKLIKILDENSFTLEIGQMLIVPIADTTKFNFSYRTANGKLYSVEGPINAPYNEVVRYIEFLDLNSKADKKVEN